MSKSIALGQIIGNAGADPEMRFTQNGTAVTNFPVAVNADRGRSDSEEDPPPHWYRVVCFGRLGEIADEYIKKGTRVYVTGRLRIEDWTGNDGQERRTVEIVANDFVLLTPREEAQMAPSGSSAPSSDDELDNLPF